MPNRSRNKKRDLNALAHLIVAEATGAERADLVDMIAEAESQGKNPAAVLLGRQGGLKGGKARAKHLSPERRKEIAQRAAQVRWHSQR